jgi:predicted RNA-binding Zn ribbon-like protein
MSSSFPFVAGDTSLDLVNTEVHRAQVGGSDDLLSGPDAARQWFMEAGLLNSTEAEQVDPAAVRQSALRLRAALDALYRPLAHRTPDSNTINRSLVTLNAVLDQGRERVQVRATEGGGGGFERTSHFEKIGPLDPSVQVARSAANLLQRLEVHRLKECEHPACDLLFYDESRNASRRWCSMESCGNQQKQARFRRSGRTLA